MHGPGISTLGPKSTTVVVGIPPEMTQVWRPLTSQRECFLHTNRSFAVCSVATAFWSSCIPCACKCVCVCVGVCVHVHGICLLLLLCLLWLLLLLLVLLRLLFFACDIDIHYTYCVDACVLCPSLCSRSWHGGFCFPIHVCGILRDLSCSAVNKKLAPSLQRHHAKANAFGVVRC